MTNSREQQQVLYEEEEVLWAKIRGYPWWPAFVDKLHPPVRGKEAEYTVFFFGDNTQYPSSKLGASKLRKFYENYSEFYQKARAHRKLMNSIQMAEEKLKQNDQNVEIFEELRNNLKNLKKEKSRSPVIRKQSRISEPDPEPLEPKEIFSLPDLNKSKTTPHAPAPRARRSQQHKQARASAVVAEEEQSQSGKASPSKQQVQPLRQTEKLPKKQIKKDEMTPSPPKRKRTARQQIFQEQQQPKSTEKVTQQKEDKLHPLPQDEKVEKMVEEEVIEEAEESEEIEAASEEMDQQEDGAQEESEDVVFQKKLRAKTKRHAVQALKGQPGQRKRGRPKKRLLRHHSQQEKEFVRPQTSRITHIKRKIIHKARPSPRKPDLLTSPLSEQDSRIIDQIRKILHRRQDLIEYLGNISITINNVQEILDLGVSNILQDGEKTPKINEILLVLRNVLLYKYFPQDVKHRKKYEQILKKKPIIVKNEEKEKEDSEEERQDQSIRKKTIIKLEKFLKAHPDVHSKARQLAVKIESYFQKADKEVGEVYKSLAFKVLSTLKQKKESYHEVIKKLEHHAYD